METLFIFLVKSSGLIGMFYLSYFILLRKETFFNSNRWFLLAGLITSVVLPLVVFTKIVWVDPILTTIDWSQIPVTTPVENEAFEINWYLISTIVYSIGILGFLVKFAFDFYSLSKVLNGKTIQHQADFKFINVTENIAPFSYFNYIVYNSSLYNEMELENILEHEKVHSTQNHTVDVLFSRLFCVVFWFNPLVWMYKKAIVQNLEFIADSEASKNISDKKAYQLTLLKITTQENCVAITNHFYQSLIKKRIVMLNKNQSNKRNSWKYAVVLPLLGAFLFFFQVKVVAQEKESGQTEIKLEKIDKTNLIITKNTTDEEIKEHCEQIKKMYNIDLSFFNIKRNSNREIINIESKFKSESGTGSCSQFQIKNTPIKPFKFLYNENKKEIGYINMDLASLSKGKEIIINGKVSSQDELDKLNPNEIKSIAGNTKNGKPTIEIDTKNEFKPVKITDKDIYIDGVKSTNEEFSKLDQRTVEKVDVNTFENTVRITTKTIYISADNFENKTISKQKPIIILNGKRTLTTFEDLNKLDSNLIQSMNVLKGKSAVDKYGKEGENGAIEIITKENADLLKYNSPSEKKETVVNGWKVSAIPATRNAKEMIADDKNIDYKKAVIIIDGKISNTKKLNKLNPNEIVSVSVQKIGDSQKHIDEMVQKYGEKALNGIIEIETKGNTNHLKQSQTKTKNEATQDKSDIENTGNETVLAKERWLETYKTIWKARFSLEKMNAQKGQAKVDLEKAKKSLKSKLFS
jgi:hypothetical protein